MERRRFMALLGTLPAVALGVASRGCDKEPGRPFESSLIPFDVGTPRPGIVRARDGGLWLDGERYRFLGVNIYSLLSPSENSGRFRCGRRFTDDGVRRTLERVRAMGANAVRIAAYRSFTEGGAFYDRLDLVMDEAERVGVRLILMYDSQWGYCAKTGLKHADWYRKHYRGSYRPYVLKTAERYIGRPGLLAHQLINEGRSLASYVFPDPGALELFGVDMASAIRAIDPDHLISLGTEDDDRFGLDREAFERLHRIPHVDLVETHDYGADEVALPGATRRAIAIAKKVGKPYFIGEMGMTANDGRSKDMRAYLLGRKVRAAYRAGVDGVLIWSYGAGDTRGYDFWPGDPLEAKLRAISKEFGIRPA